MLRLLRIVGIVVFALLLALSANNLEKMHKNGELLERYNSDRKANITLVTLSVIVVGILGYFELTRHRRLQERRGYGSAHRTGKEPVDSGEAKDAADIYAAPKTIDDWQGRKARSPRSRHQQSADVAVSWMKLLRICCVVLPVLYIGMLFIILSKGQSELLVAVFAGMAAFSTIVLFGIIAKRIWGLTLGYLLAVFNLLIFPYGTAAGLFLLVGLVGATPLFALKDHQRRRYSREKSKRQATAF